MTIVTAAPLRLRTSHEWRRSVVDLLDFLPALYPDGAEWLERRLDDVERGDAWCSLLQDGGEIVGVALGVLKSNLQFKICTLYVRPESRHQGGGASLVWEMRRIALMCGAQGSYITAAHTVSEDLWRTLEPAGFCPQVTQLDRYGVGRHETVFSARY